MFDRAELEIAIGVTLAAAILLGWLLHVLWRRLAPVPTSHAGRVAVMARRLHEAEEARDAAIEARIAAESALDSRNTELQRALAEQEARLSSASTRREAELERALQAMTEDRDSLAEDLGAARTRIEALERPGETQSAGQDTIYDRGGPIAPELDATSQSAHAASDEDEEEQPTVKRSTRSKRKPATPKKAGASRPSGPRGRETSDSLSDASEDDGSGN